MPKRSAFHEAPRRKNREQDTGYTIHGPVDKILDVLTGWGRIKPFMLQIFTHRLNFRVTDKFFIDFSPGELVCGQLEHL